MIILIAGATHAGKTALAQKLMIKYQYPYLSIDHLKMGLIRSGNTALTPLSSDEALTAYLWPIVREIIKTAIENKQNLIVEGCYIPFRWEEDFTPAYKSQIRYYCLVLSQQYIRDHYDDIMAHANIIEQRLDDSECTMAYLTEEHGRTLQLAQQHQVNYVLIDDSYQIPIEL